MRSRSRSKYPHRWPLRVIWALLIIASIVLIVMGLWRTMFFIYAPEPALVERAKVGALYIFAGSFASLIAAVTSVFMKHPWWVCAFVAAPAVLVGGYELLDPTSLLRVVAAAVAFPFAVLGLYWGSVRQRDLK
jgi:hypothetical protein